MNMQQKKQASLSYLILFLIASNFYINRILARFVFQSAGKWGWIAMTLVAILLIPVGFLIYFLAQPVHLKKWKESYRNSRLIRIFLRIATLTSTFLCLVFTMTLTNASWLEKTPYFLFVLPFFAIIYYVLKHGIPTFLNLATISIYPIAIQYLIFVLAKHKTFDFYALIPFSGQNISQPLMLGIAFLAMLLEPFWLLFYLDENSQPIKKGSFICVFTILLLTLIYDALIVTGQFGLLVSKIPFVYYESWRAINFGQYIVYLDIFAFFYWITSAFCRITLGVFLWHQSWPKASLKKSLTFLIVLYLTLIYTLNHVMVYASIRFALLLISLISLILAIGFNSVALVRRNRK